MAECTAPRPRKVGPGKTPLRPEARGAVERLGNGGHGARDQHPAGRGAQRTAGIFAYCLSSGCRAEEVPQRNGHSARERSYLCLVCSTCTVYQTASQPPRRESRPRLQLRDRPERRSAWASQQELGSPNFFSIPKALKPQFVAWQPRSKADLLSPREGARQPLQAEVRGNPGRRRGGGGARRWGSPCCGRAPIPGPRDRRAQGLGVGLHRQAPRKLRLPPWNTSRMDRAQDREGDRRFNYLKDRRLKGPF